MRIRRIDVIYCGVVVGAAAMVWWYGSVGSKSSFDGHSAVVPVSHMGITLLQDETVAVDTNELYEGAVHIRNDGDAGVTIARIKASCSCVISPMSSASLRPGDTTTIRYTLQTGLRKAGVYRVALLATLDTG